MILIGKQKGGRPSITTMKFEYSEITRHGLCLLNFLVLG